MSDRLAKLVRTYGTGASSAILEALVDGESYGLEIRERVRLRTGGALFLGPGSLYPSLHALERDGLTTSRDEKQPRGGRPKVYYALTAFGREVADGLRDEALLLYGSRSLR